MFDDETFREVIVFMSRRLKETKADIGYEEEADGVIVVLLKDPENPKSKLHQFLLCRTMWTFDINMKLCANEIST